MRSAKPEDKVKTRLLEQHSLQTRLTVAALGIALFILWSSWFYLSRTLRTDMEALLSDQQLSAVTYMASQVDSDIRGRIQALEMVANAIGLDQLSDRRQLQSFLDNRLVLHRLFNAGITAFDLDASTIAMTPFQADRAGVLKESKDLVEKLRGTGKPTIGALYFDSTEGNQAFSIAVPIRSSQGEVIGVLAGHTRLQIASFLDQIAKTHYGKTGIFQLFDANHTLIVKSAGIGTNGDPCKANPTIERFHKGEDGSTVCTDKQGRESLVSIKHLPNAGWHAVVSLPAKEAFGPLFEMQRRMLLSTLVH